MHQRFHLQFRVSALRSHRARRAMQEREIQQLRQVRLRSNLAAIAYTIQTASSTASY
jgi:hypothetical protein